MFIFLLLILKKNINQSNFWQIIHVGGKNGESNDHKSLINFSLMITEVLR